MERVVTSQLQHYERTYRALAAELADVGFISPGSVVLRYTSCGKPGCRCQGDPPQRHGPYYQWSRAVAGKTVSRRLSEGEAGLYRSWIANPRRLARIVAQMEQTSADAGEVMPQQTAPPEPPRSAKLWPPTGGEPNGPRELRNVSPKSRAVS